MGKPFTVNINRFDPYKNYRFLVFFGTSVHPVAGVSKVTGMKRTSDVIEYKEGGNAIILKGIGRTKYEPITLERGVTHDDEFEKWANAAQVLDKGSPLSSLGELRKEIRIELQNEDGQAVQQYIVHRCWVSEYQALRRSRRRWQRHRARARQARERRMGARPLVWGAGRESEGLTCCGCGFPSQASEVGLRPPLGAEDILLLEAGPPDLSRGARVARRVACDSEGAPLDPGDAAHRRRRRAAAPAPPTGRRGRRQRRGVVRCARLSRARRHHVLDRGVPRPSPPRGGTRCAARRRAGLVPSGRRGDVEFRVPSAADQLAIARERGRRAGVGAAVHPSCRVEQGRASEGGRGHGGDGAQPLFRAERAPAPSAVPS